MVGDGWRRNFNYASHSDTFFYKPSPPKVQSSKPITVRNDDVPQVSGAWKKIKDTDLNI